MTGRPSVTIRRARGIGTTSVAAACVLLTTAGCGGDDEPKAAAARATQEPAPGASAGSPTYFRDDARYDLRDTAVSVQVVDELPSIVAPTGRRGSVDVHRDLP